MIVDSNSPAPISYIDPTFSPQLFIQATILDITSGSPVVAGRVPLVQLTAGFLYLNLFTFQANHQYVIQKFGYLDGTYATIDQSIGPSSDDVQCIDLKTALIGEIEASVSGLSDQISGVDADVIGVSGQVAGVSGIADEIAMDTDIIISSVSGLSQQFSSSNAGQTLTGSINGTGYITGTLIDGQ